MAQAINKDALFDDYFATLTQVVPIFESVFSVRGIWEQITGLDETESYPFSDKKVRQYVAEKIRASNAWKLLSELYDYAVEGIQPDGLDGTSIVINGAEVLSLIDTENYSPSNAWSRIVKMGDGRYAVDDGMDVELEKLALLANVDERTVRNAVSAGELQARKEGSIAFVENGSARAWLSGRRGYKPTKPSSNSPADLAEISTPPSFGAFLSARRQMLGGVHDGKNLIVFHPSVDAKALQQLEKGVFLLPLDAVFPIADFYQLDRATFLACVMRTFFRDELAMLVEKQQSV